MPVGALGAADKDDWRRLAEAVIRRRAELDVSQEQLYEVGGPAPSTMRLIEGALRTGYRESILVRLERALDWKGGSVRQILAGGSATPVEEAGRRARTTVKPGPAKSVADGSDERIAAEMERIYRLKIPASRKLALLSDLARLMAETDRPP